MRFLCCAVVLVLSASACSDSARGPLAPTDIKERGLSLLLTGPPPTLSHTASGPVPFPPRNETFDFRSRLLEDTYRLRLGRPPVTTHVDIEGDVVWTQEYLRHRLNGLTHALAIDAVRSLLDRTTNRPGRLLDDHPGYWEGLHVEFPPRNEVFDFRSRELEKYYRDLILRPAVTTHVDIEGSVVWLQQYLLHRLNGCSHGDASSRVLTEIDTGRPQESCSSPVAACTFEVSPRQADFPSSGGSGAITVTTQAGCEWYLERSANIEDIVTPLSGRRSGSATVPYTVRVNRFDIHFDGPIWVHSYPTEARVGQQRVRVDR